MDKVVQQNAADAEETASASEEMRAQASQLKCFVDELELIIKGDGTKPEGRRRIRTFLLGFFVRGRKEAEVKPAVAESGVNLAPVAEAEANTALPAMSVEAPASQDAEEHISPEKVIPFDEDLDF
jgi:methyl-accepting chemotaxis protein